MVDRIVAGLSLMIVVILMIILGFIIFNPTPSYSKDFAEQYKKQMETLKQRGHKTYHWWYKKQMMPHYPQVNCCDDKDCQPVRWRYNLQWEVQVWVEGQWQTPPKDLIQRKKTPDNGAHACWSRSKQGSTDGWMMWFCIILPKETS